MRQTLFHIPHWFLDGPLLALWAVAGLLIFVFLVRRYGWTSESLNFLPVYLAGAALIWFVIPSIEVAEINPDDPAGPPRIAGLAVRGYGLMMLLGLAAGIGLSMIRGRRDGVDPDQILTLAFWMVICGIVGARLFYVIQKADEFANLSPGAAVGKMLNMTEGGLVVYGSLIGAALGGWFYLWRARLPVLKMADIAAPGMAAGLALGRIGCLMNGCCFGGTCDLPAIAQQFPAGSAPYMSQLYTGELIGIDSATRVEPESGPATAPGPDWLYARSVQADSLAETSRVQSNSWFRVELPQTALPVDKYFRAEAAGIETGLSFTIRQPLAAPRIPLGQAPRHSLGVYPTQTIAAINAALLCALLWFYFPFRRYHGRVFAMLLVLYAITRFLIELIRRDELGQFGTSLTISQWVSFLMLGLGLILFFGARQRTPGAVVIGGGPR